tara:strand:- start:15585 stop:15806 length:222 start_codon:yes stop_codon:yes gene_type:complete
LDNDGAIWRLSITKPIYIINKLKTKRMKGKIIADLDELCDCKMCNGKGYHKLSCPNSVKRPVKIGIEIKSKNK